LLDIKTAYVYNRTGNFYPDSVSAPEKVISSIIIPGNSSYTLEYFYQLLGYKPTDTLDMIKLNDTVSRLRTSGLFDSLAVQITELDPKSVSMIVKIHERKKPLIYGVTFTGNRNLPFRFINQLVGLKPGDQFDKQIIGERIRFMYGLGYFEEITYALDPVRDNYVRLRLNIKEKTLRKLRLGFRYDDEYKLVGIITSQATNIPFAGLRGELSIQFAGLFKFDWIYYYPSRSLSTPIFPYIRVGYKDTPVNIFSLKSGKRIAQYDDISWTGAAGLGINIANMGILKFEYNHEYMDIKPTIEGLDPVYFPSWEGDLRMLRSELALDRLDDPLMPTRGFKIDAEFNASLKKLDSDLEYYQFKAEASIYKTLAKRHIFRLNGFYTDFSGDLPFYKYPFKGGAESFVGVEINQIESNKFAYLRLDYIYKYRKDIYPKLIVNACSYNMRDYFDIYTLNKYLYGFGIGIKFLSIIGPFELIFSRGSKSVLEWDKFVTRVYFTAGYNF